MVLKNTLIRGINKNNIINKRSIDDYSGFDILTRVRKFIFPYNFDIYPDKTKRVYGRWGNSTCNETINRKVDYTNVDHCGPCGIDELYKIRKNDTV